MISNKKKGIESSLSIHHCKPGCILLRELCSHSSVPYIRVASRLLRCFQSIRNISNFTSRGSSITAITLWLQFVLQTFSGRPPPACPSCSALNLLHVLYGWDLDATSVWQPPHVLQKSSCLLSKTIILSYSCFLPICYFFSGARQRSLICLLFERSHFRQKQWWVLREMEGNGQVGSQQRYQRLKTKAMRWHWNRVNEKI